MESFLRSQQLELDSKLTGFIIVFPIYPSTTLPFPTGRSNPWVTPGSDICPILRNGYRTHISASSYGFLFPNTWIKPCAEQQITHKGIPIRITADLSIETLQARGNGKTYLKWWKKITYSPDYCTQQGSHSRMKEKSKAFQTSKSWENSAPPNQLSNKY